MNRRPTLLAAITLTAAAALTLSACGGADSDSSKDNDKVAGADVGADKESASPSASASEAGRPKIELPSDLSYTFDWPKTGDKDKDAILSDAEQSIKAVDMAIAKQDALDKAYLFYYEEEAAFGTQKYIQDFVDSKVRTTGVYRFYEPVLNVDDDGTAAFSYCEDQGKAYGKDLKTNKVEKTKVTAQSYVIYHTSLKKNDKGVWVIQKLVSQRGSDKCQP
ncbi:hypothetical protein G5C60_22920 [Streptomyces sp. HC44]|uniref:Lipoprotein n=1 Tax=Streptomyces scabichelini TaxID=2711217 RepID=A0A6G4V937_9ACTN|nr:hypothetical protein [Streptomyces scabichelini]